MSTVGACEIDPVLLKNISDTYPKCDTYKDLRVLEKKLRKGIIPPPRDVHVIEGTMPCQALTTLRHMTYDSNYSRSTADLFVLQCKVISYIMPSYVFLEMTSPDRMNSSQYAKVEHILARIGYRCRVVNRTPSDLCGDYTCRHRYVLVGVRCDVSDVPPDITKYFADGYKPVSEVLDDPEMVPQNLWLDPNGVTPCARPTSNGYGHNDVVDTSRWGSTTSAVLLGHYGQYGK